MTKNTYSIFGFLAVTSFWITYFIMTNLRAEYSWLYKAISELGSLDAPNAWIWNLFGYILPGFCISVFSYGLHKEIQHANSSRWPLIGLMGSGIFMSISGIFPGDFENWQSLTMLLHTLGSFGSYSLFLIAAFTYPKQMVLSDYWKSSIVPIKVFTWLTILFGAWPFIFTATPAAGQRFVFFFYFAWILGMSFRLYRMNANR
ncbi:MAG: DUF998 domain-containing protein [Cyclobacteriaceae bacterium]|nr:DUF998 domain-containing protein [Cyclobacteriaceae bacterium]